MSTLQPMGISVEPSRPAYLRTLTLEQAIDRRNAGMISQDEWEAFAHVWRTSAFRIGSDCSGYADHPTDPTVALIAAQLGGCCRTNLPEHLRPRRPIMDRVPCDYNECRSYAVWVVPGRGDDDYLCVEHYAAEQVTA